MTVYTISSLYTAPKRETRGNGPSEIPSRNCSLVSIKVYRAHLKNRWYGRHGNLPKGLLTRLEPRWQKVKVRQPTNRMERMAKQGLEVLLFSKPAKKEAGRPIRISAEERRELRQRADELLLAGRNRNEIVVEFAEEYGLRLSYVRRIIEDRNDTRDKS